jgi:hypothetical protein
MVGQPGHARLFGKCLQGVVREPVLLSQGREGGPPFLLLCAWERACSLPGRISPHLPQAPLPLAEYGIVELPTRFQVRPQAFGLPFIHH